MQRRFSAASRQATEPNGELILASSCSRRSISLWQVNKDRGQKSMNDGESWLEETETE